MPEGTTTIDVLIVTALKDELDIIVKADPGWQRREDPKGFPYYVRRAQTSRGRELTIAAGRTIGMGGDLASNYATRLVGYLRPKCLAMVGICAGWRDKVVLGDVVVADRVFRYDSGKLRAFRDGAVRTEEIFQDIRTYNLRPSWLQKAQDLPDDWADAMPQLRPLSYRYQETWLLRAMSECACSSECTPADLLGREMHCPDWPDVLQRLEARGAIVVGAGLALTPQGSELAARSKLQFPDGIPLEPKRPSAHVGAFGTGSQVREDPDLFPTIASHVRKVLAVDMEAAAIGVVAEIEELDRWIVVKGVSDYADTDKDDRFRSYAMEASYRYLMAFLAMSWEDESDPSRVHGSPGGESPDSAPTRQDEIRDICARLRSSSVPVSTLWITGAPGSGKTFLAFQLASRLAREGSFIYIPEGAESDMLAFTDCVRESIPNEFFNALMAGGISTQKELGFADLLATALRAARMSGRIVIVEAARDRGSFGDESVLRRLLGTFEYSRTLRLILTAYSVYSHPPETHLVYSIPNLSLEDAVTIMRSSRPELGLAECESLHRRFAGHALSIAAWAATRESVDSGLPLKTVDRFKSLWQSLSAEARHLFAALCNEADLALPELIDGQGVEELLSVGLLSRYPSVRSNGVAFYIHQIAKEACGLLLPHKERQEATTSLLWRALAAEVPWVGPRLIDYLLNAQEFDAASDLVVGYGRDWLESSSLRTSRRFVLSVRLGLATDTEGGVFGRYLEALTYLYTGMYEDALHRFSLLVRDAYQISATCGLGIDFEIIECLRRMGQLTQAVPRFSDACIALQDQIAATSDLEKYFQGLSHFLEGHLLRHVGRHGEAFEAYDVSEKCFLRSVSPTCRIEALHCAYAKARCITTAQFESDAPVIYDHILADTRSSFLRGLCHFVRARLLATRREHSRAAAEIESAERAFRDFGSVIYYQRSCCFDAILGEVTGDEDRTRSALLNIPDGREASPKVLILKQVLQLAEITSDLCERLSTSLARLLADGNTPTVYALLCLLRMKDVDYGDIRGTYQIARIHKTEHDAWELSTRTCRSIQEVEREVSREVNVEDLCTGAFMYD